MSPGGLSPTDSSHVPGGVSLLAVRDLDVAYGRRHALRGVDLAVAPGSITALLGANGAGKSTMLRAISGLVGAQGGSVSFEGRELLGLPPGEIVRLGVCHVPEGRRVFSRQTVLENLQLGAFLERDPAAMRAGLDRVFGQFPVLAERRAQRAGTLSGGEQQMLAIGRALMGKPRLLLLDEPSLGLAPLLVTRIFGIIAEIHRAGCAIVLVEQNARQALRVADQATVLESGTVAVSGAARDLLADARVRRAYLGG